jgi:L-ascorbate metabolism protein UlaG (beta-lactamase superfamily)
VYSIWLFIHQPKFGRAPSGERLEKIRNSINYKNGQFQNLSHTTALVEGVSYYTVMKEFFFGKSKRGTPSQVLPSGKTDLIHADPAKNMLVWFGHSSYYIQLNGKRILVDPVLSGSASPVKFTTRSFKGSDVYTAEEIPEIDYLLITHDHWDHLDYETIIKLKPKIKKIITGLGVGAHLEYWRFDKNIIIEKDWNEEVILDEGFRINTAPARHFSGRSFKRNASIWSSFILTTPGFKIFIGGDSGYDTHFADIGNKYGPFDLAILENGQYNEYWRYIHMLPEEVVQAAQDLKAEKLMPVHWSKFSLAIHSWDDPILRITKEASKKNIPLVTPKIGDEVNLDEVVSFRPWWSTVQ